MAIQERFLYKYFSAVWVFIILLFIGLGCFEPLFACKPEISVKFIRGLWVRAAATAAPDSIPRIIELVDELGITDLFVQVVVGGYAYYHSKYLPRSQYLSRIGPEDYTPLDSLLKSLSKRPVRVHAWVNTFLVWSMSSPPDSQTHLYYTHPGWFIRDVNNHSIVDYPFISWLDMNLEGLYLDPEKDSVREFLSEICKEISYKFPVAGVHLDFVRYPGALFGLDQTDESALLAGKDENSLGWLSLFRYPGLKFIQRWRVWHYWKINKLREQNITRFVSEVRTKLRKGCLLSAAVFAQPGVARYRFAQNWIQWDDLDLPVIMSYTRDVKKFEKIVKYTLGKRPDAVFGIGILWPDMEDEVLWQVKLVKKSGGAGISFFDYTTIRDTIFDLTRCGVDVIDKNALFMDTTSYRPDSIIIEPPDSVWAALGRKEVSRGEDLEFAGFLLALSLDPIQDIERLHLSQKDFINFIRDDIAAFRYLDKKIFPLDDTLIQPPGVVIKYSFIPGEELNTNRVINPDSMSGKLEHEVFIYPEAGNKFVSNVFKSDTTTVNLFSTTRGLYIYKVIKKIKGGGRVLQHNVKTEEMPIHKYWTINNRLTSLFTGL